LLYLKKYIKMIIYVISLLLFKVTIQKKKKKKKKKKYSIKFNYIKFILFHK